MGNSSSCGIFDAAQHAQEERLRERGLEHRYHEADGVGRLPPWPTPCRVASGGPLRPASASTNKSVPLKPAHPLSALHIVLTENPSCLAERCHI